MNLKICLTLCVIIGLTNVYADEPSFGPVIEGYGPTYPIEDRDVPLRKGFVYKAVFDAAAYSDQGALNNTLVSVARFLNMHARNGVPPENMSLAVVAHGQALRALLTDSAFSARYGIDNPNSELLEKLHAAGVSFYVCGQSMEFGGFDKQELASPVEVALSAMTMLTQLQSDGFALLP